jgi:hypothetical protein
MQNAKQIIRPVPFHKYYVFLWKDQLDVGTHWLKKLFFWLVYRPFCQFCRFHLGLPTFNAEECCHCKKRLLWTEHQGTTDEEWQALQACKNPNWGYHELPHNVMLSEATVVKECTNHNYPLSDASPRYKHNGKPTVAFPQVDVLQLAKKLAATEGLVEKFTKPVI